MCKNHCLKLAIIDQVNETKKPIAVKDDQAASKNVAKPVSSASTSKVATVPQNPNRLPTEDETSSQKPLLLEISDEEDEIMSL